MSANTAENIAQFAAQAVDYIRKAVDVEVGYDSETLPVVDHYLNQVPTEQADTTNLIVAAVGAYFGEVVIRALGGRWDADAADPGAWRVVLPVGMSFSPAAAVLSALARDDAADIDLHTPSVLHSFTEEALERMGEVDADEYYSLCGRFDTLEHLHSVLVAAVSDAKSRKESDSG